MPTSLERLCLSEQEDSANQVPGFGKAGQSYYSGLRRSRAESERNSEATLRQELRRFNAIPKAEIHPNPRRYLQAHTHMPTIRIQTFGESHRDKYQGHFNLLLIARKSKLHASN